MNLTVGFIGFGEAGCGIARGLTAEGGAGADLDVRAYDILVDDPARRGSFFERATLAQVEMLDSCGAMIPPCDIVFSAVTASNCLAAARSAAPHLRKGQCYVDINSNAPAIKREAQAVVEPSGAAYVDAGVMGAVPKYGHRVPMLLAGAAAPRVVTRLKPLGMDLQVLGPDVGQAAATKMMQSVVIKGSEALILEFLLAATALGVQQVVFESLARATPGYDWAARAKYQVSRAAQHGERRAAEMDEVVATLRALGVEPLVAAGAAQRLHWAAERLGSRFAGESAPDYREVLDALRNGEGA